MMMRSPGCTCTALCSPAAMSASAELGSPWLPVEGARVELEVARVHDRADRRFDPEADPVRDRVRHADRLDGERADRVTVAWSHRPEVGALVEPVLAQALGDECLRQRRAEDGDARLTEEIWQRADVVLVAMGQEDRAKAVALGERVGEVRDHVVDAGHLVGVREHEAAIDGDQIVAGLDEHHVEADLAESAEGNKANRGLHENSFRYGGFIVPSTLRRFELSWSRRRATARSVSGWLFGMTKVIL